MTQTRPLLEVLKFLSPIDVLREAETVNSEWKKCCGSDELWWVLIENLCLSLPGLRSNSVKDALASYIRSFQDSNTTLALLRGQSLTLISVADLSEKTYTLDTNTEVMDDNAYCLLSPTRLVTFGAGDSRAVYSVHFLTGTVSALEPMLRARWLPGTLRYRDFVYLFGGKEATAEKYGLKTAQWTLIASKMASVRRGITTARHRLEVYLPDTDAIDVFHLETETFTTSDFRPVYSWWFPFAVVYNHELIVIQKNKIQRWDLETDNKTQRVSDTGSLGYGYWSNCPGVWFEGKRYCLHNDVPYVVGVLEYDPQTEKFSQVVDWNTQELPM